MTEFAPTPSQDLAKQLLRLGINKAGGLRASSEWTGVDVSELSRMQKTNVDRHVHFARIIEIDEASEHAILKAWARRYGLEIVSVDEQAKPVSVSTAVGNQLEASAAFSRTALDVSADGKATPSEIRELQTTKHAAIATIERTFDAVTAAKTA